MNSYHVVIDDSMIRNMMQTNTKESIDLLTINQILYFIMLGLLPSYIILKTKIKYKPFKIEIFAKIKTIIYTIILIVISILIFSKHYTSFFREHKPLRYTINPLYWIYSIGNYTNKTFNSAPIVVKEIGKDATISNKNKTPKLVIMVVGEAARADHFSLNGYKRETNPLLKQENIINFDNMYSCGTSTAASVPCMFSLYPKSDFSYKRGIDTQNVLDVLDHTNKISILWRDNNSDSKGVAVRVAYQGYRTTTTNTICTEDECRDIGMLVGLEEYIKKQETKDILIVLHQMGNHGPAYYKRYTKNFEKFTPVCKSNLLEQCTKDEISNAYDNAILYTDNFLVKTINLLKKYDKSHQTAMIYMADHGESLGENGIYLHGLPYFMAPDAQTHIGSIMWFNNQFNESLNIKKLKENSHKKYSHDNLFHTLLGIFNVKTKVYDLKLDMLNGD
jgi:lipid A ethanolaminephosphotransferase